MKLDEIIVELQNLAGELNELENNTLYKGPLIDAGIDVKIAIKNLRKHARNEERRAQEGK